VPQRQRCGIKELRETVECAAIAASRNYIAALTPRAGGARGILRRALEFPQRSGIQRAKCGLISRILGGSKVAPSPGDEKMAYITMWRVGQLKCVLVLDGGNRELRLIDGPNVVRRQLLSGEASAAALATQWQGHMLG
jgi:hypothetical protein